MTITPTGVVLPLEVAADLVAGHVHDLWSAWVNDTDSPGCCPVCCAPCHALKRLLDLGLLDDLYGAYVDRTGGNWSAWDAEKMQVDRKFLTEAWSADLGCREFHEES